MKIVCPVDFSPSSINAIEYAALFAKEINAQIELLHIQSIDPVDELQKKLGLPSDIGSQSDSLFELIEKYCQEVTTTYGVNCSYTTAPLQGNLEEEIAEEIKKSDPELVIMGTNGSDTLYQSFFGSNTFQVIERTQVPLLVIPENCRYQEHKKIVYATDFNTNDLLALKKLIHVFPNGETNLNLLHVSDDGTISDDAIEYFTKEISKLMKESGRHQLQFTNIQNQNITQGIQEYFQEHEADLLILLTRHHNLVEKMFDESITQTLTAEANIPLLVFHSI